ncbi:MAG: S-adenosyl-l-methionine hydroxide adenosyltransferase family protein [Deltaproteobacteria bacterium]
MKPSGIITLTTDFGLSDPYVAMMKGVILSINLPAMLVDVTHQIETGSVSQAALLVRETFPYFPEGTVHLAVVDPGVGSSRRPIALEAAGHFFVGPDNGLFWPVFKDFEETRAVQLTQSRFFLPGITQTFHGREIFAPVAARLSLGLSLESLGPTVRDPTELAIPRPYIEAGILCGQIIRVDNFGNLVTNISGRELTDFVESASSRIEAGKLVIRKLSRIYADCEQGEPLALINSSGLLEIAVNLGRASEYIGLRDGELVGALVQVHRV